MRGLGSGTASEIARVAMSPEDVLATLREEYRYALAFDPEAEDGYELTFETTVAEWTEACDLIAPDGLGYALNDSFGIRASFAEWQAALTPTAARTLRVVCALVARSGATRAVVEPVRIAGVECRAAGAFFVLRRLLAARGILIADARPSTPIGKLRSRQIGTLLHEAARLAPGALPIPRVPTGIDERVVGWLLLVAFIQLAIHPRWLSAWIPASALLLGVAWFAFTSRLVARTVDFGALETWGDLARAIAQHPEAH